MDEYTFIIWLISILGILVISFYFVRAVVLKKQTIDLEKKCEQLESLYKKTQLKINQLVNEFGEPQGIVSDGLGGLGVQGILESLKVNPEMLTTLAKQAGIELPGWAIPLIKGFLSKQKGVGDVSSEKPKHPSQM